VAIPCMGFSAIPLLFPLLPAAQIGTAANADRRQCVRERCRGVCRSTPCAEVHLAQKYTLRRSAHTEVLKQSRLQNTYHHRRAARAHPRPLRSPHTAPVPWATLTPHPTTIATPPLPDRLLAKARKPAPIPSAYSCKRAALCAEEGRAPGSGRPGAPIVGLRVLVGARSTAAMWGRDRYMHRTGPRSTTPRHSRRECPGHELIRLMTIVM